MKKRLQRWFPNFRSQKSAQPVSSQLTNLTIDLQREIQSLRIDADEREKRIAQMIQEITRMRERQQMLIEETVNARLTTLISELAAPTSQVRTQAHLFENENKEIHVQDVLSVTRRLIRALERNGLEFEGQIGAQVEFDPNRHTPINPASAPHLGDPVTVRFSEVRYQGKTVAKAVVA